ncbi:polysaccharide lyase family 1 protein [Aspergillus carbonarius ITEM 5010]|uniref:Polysaccharide lyase family 1 protein n=1 Tax=Aspergillus carbonarius (strain ITEM 5010) TaxID=602072 RepID=A0A1R3RFL6_ASPC5|nr:polysaccharide lyase family 1 protein [Aspergillus carbonarius ITEM 5010]
MAENYVYYTSGRSPALSGNTLFHAVNNVWAENSGHAIEGTANSRGVYEGNWFDHVPTVVANGFVGQLFSSESADLSQCEMYLGRECVTNAYTNSGSFDYDDDGFLVDFHNLPIVLAASAASIESSVPANAGNTLSNT